MKFLLVPLCNNIELIKIMDSEQLINKIRKLYPDNMGEYLFKSCSKKWIVVLKKTDDTVTNQCRLSPDNPNRAFAKYRANKLFVVDIINKFNPNVPVNEIYSSIYYGKILLYIKGKIIECDSFDENLNEVCSGGIHFYETIDCAFYLELIEIRNGKLTTWYDDGQKEEEGEYLNGEENGKWTDWYENGQKESEGVYLNGAMHGKWTWWYSDGQIRSEGEYLNGNLNGKCTRWYVNGQKYLEGEYLNGNLNGKCTRWYENGQKYLEGDHLNGKLNGQWIEWYENGQKCLEGDHLNGEKNGKWTYWYVNGQKEYEGEYVNGNLNGK